MTARRTSHVNTAGEVHMVGVGEKLVTARRAVARARVVMQADTREILQRGAGPKGEIEATVRIAGMMAAKRTPELIPLCHTVALTGVTVGLAWTETGVEITATAEANDRTGVEMEAMVAASVAALTVYDMAKGLERGITVSAVELVEKSGGRSGRWTRTEG